MSLARIDPKSELRPHLPTAGEYGAGKNGCDCKVSAFEYPAEEMLPGYDREGERGPYAYFGFQVRGADLPGGVVFHNEWQEVAEGTGSKALGWLKNLGVSVSEDGEFDPDDVVGRECIIEVGDPKESNGRIFTGRLRQVFGA